MKTIWKFILETTDEQEIEMPLNVKILSVQNQNEKPCIWGLLDPSSTKTKIRKFRIIGTGHPIEDEIERAKFIGTYQLSEGAMVFHVFDLGWK